MIDHLLFCYVFFIVERVHVLLSHKKSFFVIYNKGLEFYATLKKNYHQGSPIFLV
jgi:hypothetical protein